MLSWLYCFGTRTPWSYSHALLSRVTRKDRKIGRTVSSTYVYVHKCAEEEFRTAKCAEEEFRTARRSDRTRCAQYFKDVVSNSLPSRSQDPATQNKIFRNTRTKTRYMRIISQKNAENSKNIAQDTDHRQEVFRARNTNSGLRVLLEYVLLPTAAAALSTGRCSVVVARTGILRSIYTYIFVYNIIGSNRPSSTKISILRMNSV